MLERKRTYADELAASQRLSYLNLTKPVASELGWDRGLTSLAFSLSWISFGFLSIAAGRLGDRYGSRALMFIGSMVRSQLNSLWQLYVILGFILPVGRAAHVIPPMATVLNWFVHR